MRKKRMNWNVYMIMHSAVALIAGIAFGILIGRGMAVIGKAPVFKQHSTELLAFVTGHPNHQLSKPQYVTTYLEKDSKALGN